MGTATASLVAGWLLPILIVVSILLLARSFYILYVKRQGNRTSAVITWMTAVFVVGYWSWRLVSAWSVDGSPFWYCGYS